MNYLPYSYLNIESFTPINTKNLEIKLLREIRNLKEEYINFKNIAIKRMDNIVDNVSDQEGWPIQRINDLKNRFEDLKKNVHVGVSKYFNEYNDKLESLKNKFEDFKYRLDTEYNITNYIKMNHRRTNISIILGTICLILIIIKFII